MSEKGAAHRALYNKWRPAAFADVVGQNHITKTLRAQSASGRVSHAYLFCGTRGTGKTTCARILAKAVNCENPQNGDPCNECPSCEGINRGTVTDIIELDAATYTGVANIRELRDEAVYSPATVKKRVYIIDEVHMLSTSAFNAFLKILEEPPSHVLFILATTELNKVPATVLSRCQRFDFRRIPREDIADRLLHIASAEQIPLEKSGAAVLAHAADGAMRNALSLLEQAAMRAEGAPLNGEAVLSLLGMVSSAPLLRIASSVASGDTAAALSAFSAQYDGGAEPAAFVDRLLCLMRDALIVKTGGGVPLLGAGYSGEDLAHLSSAVPQDKLVYYIETLQSAFASMARSPNKRIDAELALVMLCRPSTGGEKSALAARVAALERRLAEGAPAVSPLPFAASPEPAAEPAKAPAQPSAHSAPPAGEVPFRGELISLLRDSLNPAFFAYVDLCGFKSDGEAIFVEAPDETTLSIISKKEVLSAVSVAAAEILGRPAAAKAALGGKREKEPSSSFDALLKNAEDDPEIFEIL